jgi:hypothetical protein
LDAVISTIKNDQIVDLNDSEAETLKKRLASLAKSKSIELIAKASELSRTNDRSFRSARIVSDLRPICLGDDAHVAAAVIVHQLAIRAFRNGKRESTYFALDTADLAALSAAVSRAVKKDKSLREFAAASVTPILTPQSD